jgi:hypothetical protein
MGKLGVTAVYKGGIQKKAWLILTGMILSV